MSLFEIAFAFYRTTGVAITTRAVSGAIRHLDLKNDKRMYTSDIQGSLIPRQQTAVNTIKLKVLHDYLKKRYV